MSPLVREHLAIQFSTAMKILLHDNIFNISDFPITCSRAVCHLGIIVISIQLFRERLSEKVHATIPKGIVSGYEFTVFQRNLKE